MPVIQKITKASGVAGQVQYTAVVEYPEEAPSTVAFVGNTLGGPVVMITESGHQTFVTAPERFGKFGESWVRSFFA